MSQLTQSTQNNEEVQLQTNERKVPGGPMGHTAYLNPESNSIHISNTRITPEFYTENQVTNLGSKFAPLLRKAITEIQTQGELVSDEFNKVSLVTPRYEASLEDYLKVIGKHASSGNNSILRTAAAGGAMVPDNFSTIDVVNVLSELRNTEERNFVLQDAASTINTQQIEGRIDVESTFDVQYPVPMGAEIPSSQVTYSTVTFKLDMLGAHVARFQEMTMTNLPHDPYRNSINRVGKAVIRKKAGIVNTALGTTANTTSGGASWIAVTGGASDANPWTYIGAASDEIVANDGMPEVLAFNDRTYRAYATNTWIRGAGVGSNSSSTTPSPGAAKTVQLQGSGYTAYVDNLIANNVGYIYQRDAIVSFQGPSAVTTYDDVHHRGNGYYYWEYFATKIIEQTKIRKLTGISP